jgi:hypothetical protein
MTASDCTEALDLISRKRKYLSLLAENKSRNSVDTVGVSTGRGTETFSISIPWQYVVDNVNQRIENINERLDALGVTEEA